MHSPGTLVFAFAAVAFVSLVSPVPAVVIRPDVDPSKYLGDPAHYPAVFPLDTLGKGEIGSCAATLIHPEFAVTAAHCLDEVWNKESGQYDPAKFRPFPMEIAGTTYTAVGLFPNPCYNTKSDKVGADTALIKLDRAAVGVTPIPVFSESGAELGKRIEIIGWGDTGVAGIRGSQTVRDNTFRVAENMVTSVKKGRLGYRLDQRGLPLEGIAWSGDSGGPAFITDGTGARRIAGVNSAGRCCKYGSLDEYSRLSSKAVWIERTMSTGATAPFNCATLEDDVGGGDSGGGGGGEEEEDRCAPVLMNSGVCPPNTHRHITSRSDCEAAAAELANVKDETARKVWQKKQPKGCWVKGGNLYFNGTGRDRAWHRRRKNICLPKRC